jgi:anthranilate phosphoribosyltransferase
MEWGEVLDALTVGKDLSADETAWAMAEMMDGRVTFEQFASFTKGLRAKEETTEEILGLVRVMRERSQKVVSEGRLIDTAGTGGDGAGTINVSTIAAIVMAGAGARVAKHGNRAASSSCGSADLLEELGVKLDPGPERVAECIDEAGIGFMFAPAFHPAMKHVAPFRKELGVPTIFNFLGPLTNPAGAEHQVIGVSDADMAPKMMEVLGHLGSSRALSFQGEGGVDEITTWGRTMTWELREGTVDAGMIDPAELGIKPGALGDIAGGDPSTNAKIAMAILDGNGGGETLDVILLNAAAGLMVAGIADELEDGLELSRESVDSGKAKMALQGLVECSNR